VYMKNSGWNWNGKSTLSDMRKFYVNLILSMLLGFSQAAAQKNAFYSEVGGQGVYFTLNYDRRITYTTSGFGFRVGLGYDVSFDPTSMSIPVGVYYMAGAEGNFFEVGAGATYVNITNVPPGQRVDFANKSWYGDQKFLFGTLTVGYRHQPRESHLNFRTGLTPMFGRTAMLIPYLSVGYNF
jgi:hypothetical protein